MKLNKVTIICLVIAGLLTSCVLIAKAAGFVSYEGDKMVIWDNVKIINYGLKLNEGGVLDSSYASSGYLELSGKDVYIKGFMGFDCSNYPIQSNCVSALGDIGLGIFLKTKTLGEMGLNALNIQSEREGIFLNGVSIDFQADLLLNENKNLIITDKEIPAAVNSVFVDNLRINEIGGEILNVPPIFISEGGVLQTKRIIELTAITP